MLSTEERARRNEIVRRSWAKQASKYDKSMSFFERRVFGEEHRAWAASRAYGQTLEVGIGTGLNLPLYPIDLELHGLDLSSEMVDLARIRAAAMDRSADIRVGDAHELPYASTSFDTVIATYTLCNVPDYARAIDEMTRFCRNRVRMGTTLAPLRSRAIRSADM
jgi:ubiquinone/menaquinone biosynthesis C-methylase UbiE